MQNPPPAPSGRPLRLLIIGWDMEKDFFYKPALLENPNYQCEIMAKEVDAIAPGHHRVSWPNLFKLRRRLEAGEFDLVVSNYVNDTPWPRHKGPLTQFVKGLKTLATKRIETVDAYFTPWLMKRLRDRMPMAVVDTSDFFFIPARDFDLLRACTLFFKMNLFHLPNRSLVPLMEEKGWRQVIPLTAKLRPLTCGAWAKFMPKEVRPMKDRDIDLFFSGSLFRYQDEGENSPRYYGQNFIRLDIMKRVQKLAEKYRIVCQEGMLSDEDYMEMLQRAKLVVCTESLGSETSRPYEVSASGSVPLINWPFTQNYQMLEPNEHAIYFSLIGNDFEKTVEQSLRNPELLASISVKTREHTLKYKQRPLIGDYIVNETMQAFADKQQPNPAR
jgi:hypothetical protein